MKKAIDEVINVSKAYDEHFLDDQANADLVEDIRSNLLKSEIERFELEQLSQSMSKFLKSIEKEIKKIAREKKLFENVLMVKMTDEQQYEYSRLYRYSNTADEFIIELKDVEMIKLYGKCKCLDALENRMRSYHLQKQLLSNMNINKEKSELNDNRLILAGFFKSLKK